MRFLLADARVRSPRSRRLRARAPAAARGSDRSADRGCPATVADDPLVGKPAPDFTATAQDGPTVHLAALKGKPVVVYFYPKDETPGLHQRGVLVSRRVEAISKTGVVLIGDLGRHRRVAPRSSPSTTSCRSFW